MSPVQIGKLMEDNGFGGVRHKHPEPQPVYCIYCKKFIGMADTPWEARQKYAIHECIIEMEDGNRILLPRD